MIPKGVIDAVKKFREENKTPPPSATLTTKARGQSNPTLDAIKDAGMRALQGVSTTLDAIPPSVDLYPGPVDNVAVMGLAGLNKGIKTLVKGERGMDEVVGAVNAVRALKPLTKIDDVASKIKDATKLSINKLIALNSEGFDNAISNIAKGQPSVTKGPIDVLKTGEGYLIVDGNHRVVQSMQKGLKDIDANILSKEQAIAKHPEYEIAIESALDASPSTAKLPTQPTYYRATTDGQTLGSGQKWAWTDKASAESWAKRNNAKVVEFTVPDSAIDPIDLSRMKQGTTDRFMFDTSKANTLPKLPTQTGETFYRGIGEKGSANTIGNLSTLGKGIYSSADKVKASQYGKVSIVGISDVPKNPLKIDGYRNVLRLTQEAADANMPIEQYLSKKGYDGAQIIENGQVIEQVKYGQPKSLPTQTGEIIYHGTPKEITSVKDLQAGLSTQGKGIYFTNSLEEAKKYARGKNIITSDASKLKLWNSATSTKSEGEAFSIAYEKAVQRLGEHSEEATNLAYKSLGYDGKVIDLGKGRKEYVVFDNAKLQDYSSLPTQVEGLAKEVQLSDKPYNFKYTSDEMPTTGKTITYQGKEVGGIGYGKDLNQKDAWLHNIEIDPQYRNKGIGKKAIDQFFQTSGANKVNGYAESPEAAKFFKSLGAKVDTDGNFTLSKTDFFNQSKGVQTVDIKKLEIPDFNNGVEVNGWDDIYRKSDAKTRDKMDKDINYLLKDKNNELAPIKINEDGGFVDVVDGHHRVASYRYAGREKIPFTTVNSKGVQNEGVIGAIKAVEAIRKIPQK